MLHLNSEVVCCDFGLLLYQRCFLEALLLRLHRLETQALSNLPLVLLWDGIARMLMASQFPNPSFAIM